MNISAPISREIGEVAFSFMTSEEVRSLSVKQIVNPVLFDNLNHPNSSGLYDQALGPHDHGETCATCGLGYFSCPGHFGHIELSSPSYNPITFRLMMKMLQSLCMYCHHLRLSRNICAMYATKFRLILAGKLSEAEDIEKYLQSVKNLKSKNSSAKKSSSKSMVDGEAVEGSDESDISDDDMEISFGTNAESTKKGKTLAEIQEEIIQRIKEYESEIMKDQPRYVKMTTLAMNAFRKLEREFLAAIPSGRCSNCRGVNPSFRTEGQIKIFQKPLPSRARNMMAARNLKFKNVLAAGFIESDKVEKKNKEVEMSESFTKLPTVTAEDTEKTFVEDLGFSSTVDRYIFSYEVIAHLNVLWKNEREILDLVYGSGPKRVSTPNMFFIECVSVTPTRFRPISKMNDMMFEHPQNSWMTDILKSNVRINDIRAEETESISKVPYGGEDHVNLANEYARKMTDAIISLQTAVNNLIDSSKATVPGGKAPLGIRQLLEKKEGLFRKHMMGKRVNYAARSVISPDPYIETSEIGIPPVFATKLTYPEPVTYHNVKVLRQAVINGPKKWPGATHVQHEDGTLQNLAIFDEAARTAIANQLLTPTNGSDKNGLLRVNKKVYRHLRNGDFLLLNRQPTLHKPSIMAHTARILPGEKTIRMHYANCNTYNADFDGDEMNAHFPQSELGRAEAMVIARTDQQYLVPTDGGVLRGLIQDHVDAGVGMTARDTFFTRSEYMQLLYACLRPEGKMMFNTGNGNIEEEVIIGDNGRIQIMAPAGIKPKMYWTGKQVIGTIMMNLTFGKKHLNLISKARISAKSWGGSAPEEQTVHVLDGELVTGILDKSQFGASAHGLTHAIYEVYGAPYAARILSIFGRLFTAYMQLKGFSCRMDDLRLTEQGDQIRKDLINGSTQIGDEASAEVAGLVDADGKPLGNSNKSSKFRNLMRSRLEGVYRNSEKMAGLDNAMKSRTNKVTSNIIGSCVPSNLLKPFPANNMQMMTISGAKGSSVNVSQISCLLGQQELEGKRVPTMISGKTLPSFRAYDTSARAGGFITGRFLTGIKPQEYFFHCMAGREGLIDTAVKTSRSGYLQRCLIKHLEGVKVFYDNTVRDSDGSILQFNYGEDSLDVVKQKMLTKFDFCAMNYNSLSTRYNPAKIGKYVDEESVKKYLKSSKKAIKSAKESKTAIPSIDPVIHKFNPSRNLGSVSNKFRDTLDEYVEKNAKKLLSKKGETIRKRPGLSGEPISDKNFKMLMNLKYMNSLIEPGEAVGLLAAQSIGEPSTQMTLNTFHFAGFGAKNVTLGIPRLREIIMTASASISTPMMRLPLLNDDPKKRDELVKTLTKINLSEIMDDITVEESLVNDGSQMLKNIKLRLNFWPEQLYKEHYNITAKRVALVCETRFLSGLEKAIAQELRDKARSKVGEEIGKSLGSFNDADEAADGAEKTTEEEATVPTKTTKKTTKPAADSMDSDSDSESENEAGEEDGTLNKGNKSKQTAYDEGDAKVNDNMDVDSDEDNDDADDFQTIDVDSYNYITAMTFAKDGESCELSLSLKADSNKLLMVALAEKVAKGVVIAEVPGITRAYPIENEAENDTSVNIGTDGVSIQQIWDIDDSIDVNKIYTNDIAAILRTYGVEAARTAIVQEVAGVFGVYGINVDYRHLSLIADFMTFEGGYKPFNRMGINSNPSPFTQMSFESTTTFLTAATSNGFSDDLESPSARIALGKVVRGGTGAFDVRANIQ